jgi:hypothetical protein
MFFSLICREPKRCHELLLGKDQLKKKRKSMQSVHKKDKSNFDFLGEKSYKTLVPGRFFYRKFIKA